MGVEVGLPVGREACQRVAGGGALRLKAVIDLHLYTLRRLLLLWIYHSHVYLPITARARGNGYLEAVGRAEVYGRGADGAAQHGVSHSLGHKFQRIHAARCSEFDVRLQSRAFWI